MAHLTSQKVGKKEQEKRQKARVQSKRWWFANRFSYESVTRRKFSNWTLTFFPWLLAKKIESTLSQEAEIFPTWKNVTSDLIFNHIFVFILWSLRDGKVICSKEMSYSQKMFQRWCHGKSHLDSGPHITMTTKRKHWLSKETRSQEAELKSFSHYFCLQPSI